MALLKGGVCVLPGQKLYCVNPGWYRVVFATKEDALDEGRCCKCSQSNAELLQPSHKVVCAGAVHGPAYT